MYKFIILLILVSFASAPVHAQSNCDAYTGWEPLAKASTSHVIMFGEVHGTNETADAMRGLICELVKRKIPIKFGVEASNDQSEALDAAFTWPLDKDRVLKAGPDMWSVHDGRGSQAVYDLLATLGKWRAEGADISIFAFDFTRHEGEVLQLTRSTVMAREVDKAMTGFSGAVILFSGDFHTVLNPPDSELVGGSLANEVKVRPVVALKMRHLGGEIYAKISFGGGAATSQQVKWGARMPVEAPSRSFDLTPTLTQSGYFYTGVLTASPPAFPEAAKEE